MPENITVLFSTGSEVGLPSSRSPPNHETCMTTTITFSRQNHDGLSGGDSGVCQRPLILPLFGFPWSPQLKICQSFENCNEHARNVLGTRSLTWDQAQFSFRFVNNLAVAVRENQYEPEIRPSFSGSTRSLSSQRFDSVKSIRVWSCWSLLSLL